MCVKTSEASIIHSVQRQKIRQKWHYWFFSINHEQHCSRYHMNAWRVIIVLEIWNFTFFKSKWRLVCFSCFPAGLYEPADWVKLLLTGRMMWGKLSTATARCRSAVSSSCLCVFTWKWPSVITLISDSSGVLQWWGWWRWWWGASLYSNEPTLSILNRLPPHFSWAQPENRDFHFTGFRQGHKIWCKRDRNYFKI